MGFVEDLSMAVINCAGSAAGALLKGDCVAGRHLEDWSAVVHIDVCLTGAGGRGLVECCLPKPWNGPFSVVSKPIFCSA